MPVLAVTAADIAEFRAAAERDRAPGYVADMTRTLLGILGHAQREGLIEAIPRPAEPIRVRTAGRPRDRMSLAEVEATIAALRPDWRPVGELIYLTGLRIGEVLGRWATAGAPRPAIRSAWMRPALYTRPPRGLSAFGIR